MAFYYYRREILLEVIQMKKKEFELPALYGDHHVTEVRRLLMEIPGVSDVYASSSFHIVEVTYDEKITNDLELQIKLDDAGYMGEIISTVESEKAESSGESTGTYLRHTAAYTQTKNVVSFAQKIRKQSRPLWPCPGMGSIKLENEVN